MAVKIEKHGKLVCGLKLDVLLKAGTNPKKAVKVRKELVKRKYVAPVVVDVEVAA